MLVVLLRHGIARSLGEAGIQRDEDRPLSSEGVEKTQAAVRGLVAWLAAGDFLEQVEVWSSPARRTHETAVCLAEALPGRPSVLVVEDLALDRPIEPILRDPRWTAGASTVFLVGHQPSLSALASRLVVGNDHLRLDLKRAAACCIAFAGRPRSGAGRLVALLPPRVLRGLGEALPK